MNERFSLSIIWFLNILSVFSFWLRKIWLFRISFVSVAVATRQCPRHEWLPTDQTKLTQLTFCYNEVFSISQEFCMMRLLQDGLNKASVFSWISCCLIIWRMIHSEYNNSEVARELQHNHWRVILRSFFCELIAYQRKI